MRTNTHMYKFAIQSNSSFLAANLLFSDHDGIIYDIFIMKIATIASRLVIYVVGASLSI